MTQGHLENPASSSISGVLTTSVKPLLLCKVTYSQVLGIRAWISCGGGWGGGGGGGIILPATAPMGVTRLDRCPRNTSWGKG